MGGSQTGAGKESYRRSSKGGREGPTGGGHDLCCWYMCGITGGW